MVTEKENYKVPVLLSGIGTGKSSMLDRHLESLRGNCNNEDLLKLLSVERKPLVLSATFNSGTSFSADEMGDLPEWIVARRVLAAYFGITLQEVKSSLLPSRTGVLKDTVNLISRHHRRTQGMDELAQIVILINVDELNQISITLDDEATVIQSSSEDQRRK